MKSSQNIARRLIAQEARALLTRLERVKPFVLHETMVPAAALSLPAQNAIEHFMGTERKLLRQRVQSFLIWLERFESRQAMVEQVQRRFTFLRMQFNTVLSQFDIFSDVITQRSEHETGVWLAGLDVVAKDALTLPGNYYDPPPVVCYLDRGHGAAIRRARTRLPGGRDNPVAIVRVPRERMVGSGVASSLVHEVGHQGSALLDLVDSIRPNLRSMQRNQASSAATWRLYERWISEILSDLWSVSQVGVASTLGLMGVVSLPRAFVFRAALDDPHPIPWIRVKISCALGAAMYPHFQWQELASIWESYYPTTDLPIKKKLLLGNLEKALPDFVGLLLNQRPRKLRGESLGEVLSLPGQQPQELHHIYKSWSKSPGLIQKARPVLVFAVLGQARVDGLLSPEQESSLISSLLAQWAMRSALDVSAACVRQLRQPVPAMAV